MEIKEIVGTVIRGEQVIKFPLKVDSYTAGWVSDSNGNHIADIRGWGRLQYHSDGEDKAAEIQDAIGKWIVETLNAEANRLGLDTK